MTITRQLNTIVSTPPYLRDEDDKKAVVQSLINLQEALQGVEGLTWITPKAGITAEQFINSVGNPLNRAVDSANGGRGTDRRHVIRSRQFHLDVARTTGSVSGYQYPPREQRTIYLGAPAPPN